MDGEGTISDAIRHGVMTPLLGDKVGFGIPSFRAHMDKALREYGPDLGFPRPPDRQTSEQRTARGATLLGAQTMIHKLRNPEHASIDSAAIMSGYAEAERIHAEHLKPQGVTLPPYDTAKGLWLGVLFAARKINPDGWVFKDDVSALCQRERPQLTLDQRPCRLRGDGWNVETDSLSGPTRHRIPRYRIADPYTPWPEWVRELARKRGRSWTSRIQPLHRVVHRS